MPISDHVDAVLAAADRRDLDALSSALRRVGDGADSASPEEVQDALARLCGLLLTTGFGVGEDLVGLVGLLAPFGTDPTAAVPALVERAAEVMEMAGTFGRTYRKAFGPLPPADDPERIGPTLARVPGAQRAVAAWFCLDGWVRPVVYLSQHAAVRAMLPQRERLAAAIPPVRDTHATPRRLEGLLRVLDDERLVVLDRDFAGTGTGFHVTIGGIADNAQLYTLLAAALIGEPADGLLPGRRPTPAEIAAVTEPDAPRPPGGTHAGWALRDAAGGRIGNDGTPADIPRVEDVRVVVLDAEPNARSWPAGKAYPLMTPAARVERRLTPEEAAQWWGRVKPAAD
ncbi:hypothetical protein Val02_17790 [Virgisporangium aliadipatigenens]|uniref:Uncharacterized protein n=1 Tax=Virgisporangium aliadipatigenens TaxID=741659 RepID=A0A8J4DPQ1_9ACTN|nr:hypothetical protein [Virgisporangium aliadipatigenens]GIJ44893.1 hypothetical protein Val02_17790 [Virgisporangium aliadipatigenens]